MADEFNPYRDWLGWTDSQRPNHYELLGLAPLDSNAEQIAAAAERATTKVRSFRPGPNARAWSQLLDEIHAAKECLSDPARRAEYDRSLARQEPVPAEAEPTEAPEASPPMRSVLEPLQSELYPPGMARPAAMPQTIVAAEAAPSQQERPRSDLDPPLRRGAAPTGGDNAPIADDAAPIDDPPPTMPEAPGWAAGPSPIYAATASSSYPIAAGNPVDESAADLPMALPVSVQPLNSEPLPASVAPPDGGPPGSTASIDPMAPVAVGGLPLAGMEPSLTERRPRAGRFGMMTAALGGIVLLVAFAVAGLSFLRQPGQAGHPLAEKPAAPSTDASPETAAVEPKSSAKSPSQNPRATTIPPSPDPVPTPAPPARVDPASPPASAPAPARLRPSLPAPPQPVTPAPRVTRDEVQELIQALDAAKAAVAEHDFQAADAQLAKAESLAKLPKHRETVARLREIAGYVRQFRQAVAAAVQDMQAGEAFKVGNSTQVAFVEGSADRVVLRIAGMNRTYPFSDMPPGLALTIADFKLAANDPASRVVKGAYLLAHKRADTAEREKAIALWQEAQRLGMNVSHLMPFLNDNYADLLKDVPAG